MAVSRRKPATPRRPPSHEPPTRVKLSFIGAEIDAAIARIKDQGQQLPRKAQRKVRIATSTLRHCKMTIKAAVDCGSWGAKL